MHVRGLPSQGRRRAAAPRLTIRRYRDPVQPAGYVPRPADPRSGVWRRGAAGARAAQAQGLAL